MLKTSRVETRRVGLERRVAFVFCGRLSHVISCSTIRLSQTLTVKMYRAASVI